MTSTSRDLWAATLGGLVVGGLVESVASIVSDSVFALAAGAFIGGLVAAYLLYGKISHAVLVGALSGLLGTPFFLGLSQILVIFELIPTPSGPSPPMAELQNAVVLLVGLNFVAGAAGGLLAGAVHHPPQEPAMAPPSGAQPAAPVQPRYCVQCGAQLPTGAVVCPHCNARQPQ